MSGHGQRATKKGTAARFSCLVYYCGFVHSCLPVSDSVAGGTCSPGVGTSHEAQSGLGPAKQKPASFSRNAKERQKKNLICSNTEEEQPG